MTGDAILDTHLAPGERLIWRGASSDALRKAYVARRSQFHLALALATGGLAILAGYRFYEVLIHASTSVNLASAFAAPLYVAFALGLGAASGFFGWSFVKQRSAPAAAPDHYAATNLRLIAVDGGGTLFDQIAAADIASVDFSELRHKTHLIVQRRDPDADAFVIAHVENPDSVKALITETFPEPAP